MYINNSITHSSVLADWTKNMTKKDYELIANVFRKESENLSRLLGFKGKVTPFNDGQLQELRTLMQNMAFWLGQENPKFDKEKFYKACLAVED